MAETVTASGSMSDLIKTGRATLAEQKKQLDKQQEDGFKLMMVASTPNPLDGKGGMKPKEMMDVVLTMQKATSQIQEGEARIVQYEIMQQMLSSSTSSLAGQGLRIEGDQIAFKDKPVHFAYQIPEGGVKDAELFIIDENEGKNREPVLKIKAELDAGLHRFVWDGLDKDKVKLPAGNYSVLVRGSNKPGEMHAMKTYVYGSILEIEHDKGETFMLVQNPNKGYQRLPFRNDGSLVFASKELTASA
jgi:flagellar hook assembly protein FlgD